MPPRAALSLAVRVVKLPEAGVMAPIVVLLIVPPPIVAVEKVPCPVEVILVVPANCKSPEVRLRLPAMVSARIELAMVLLPVKTERKLFAPVPEMSPVLAGGKFCQDKLLDKPAVNTCPVAGEVAGN